MARVFICDKCKKMCDKVNVVTITLPHMEVSDKTKGYDLCSGCGIELLKFLKGEKSDEDNI